MQTIICMKWGNKYNHNYVNNLYSSIKTHTKIKTDLIMEKRIIINLLVNEVVGIQTSKDINTLQKNYIILDWN